MCICYDKVFFLPFFFFFSFLLIIARLRATTYWLDFSPLTKKKNNNNDRQWNFLFCFDKRCMYTLEDLVRMGLI